MNSSSPPAPANPFSAKRLRPGVISFIFPRGMDWPDLDLRLCDSGYCGQVIGPHGTGKSTLFAEWQERLDQQGWRVVMLRMHNSASRRLRLADLRQLVAALIAVRGDRTMVMLDGHEQLSAWQRWCVRSWLRFWSAGLLVTTHRDIGLPTVFRTQTNVALAGQVAREIAWVAANGDDSAESRDSRCDGATVIPENVVEQLWKEHAGNIRETLFSLYDWCETDVQPIAAPEKSA